MLVILYALYKRDRLTTGPVPNFAMLFGQWFFLQHNYDSASIRLSFDCRSTVLDFDSTLRRPFDAVRHERTLTCARVLLFGIWSRSIV